MVDEDLERAWSSLDRREVEEALRFAQQSLDRSGESAAALVAVAFAKIQLGDFTGAREAAQRAIDLEPSAALPHYTVGCAHVALGEFEAALAPTLRAIEIDPQQASFYAILGEASYYLDRFEAACDAGWKASSLDPTSGGAKGLIGRALARLDRPEDAKRALEAALVLEPDDASHHEALGDLALERRDFDSALRHYAEALRLDPNRDASRAGALDALDGKRPRLRPVLGYLRWGAALGAFHRGHALSLGVPMVIGLERIGRAVPAHAIWIHGLGILIGLIAATMWSSIPLLNAMLYADPVGRIALGPLERFVARGVVACLGLGGLLVIPALAFDSKFVWLAIGVLACAVPISEVGSSPTGWRRDVTVLIAFLCLAAAGAAIVFSALGEDHRDHVFAAGGAASLLAFLSPVAGSIFRLTRTR